MFGFGQGERSPLQGQWRRYILKEEVEEASGGEGSIQGKGLHLFKDSRNRKGCLRELETPFCCSESENPGSEDHSGTEVSVCGSPTGNLTTRHGAGASYLASPWPWARLPACGGSSQLARGCGSSTSRAGPHSTPPSPRFCPRMWTGLNLTNQPLSQDRALSARTHRPLHQNWPLIRSRRFRSSGALWLLPMGHSMTRRS